MANGDVTDAKDEWSLLALFVLLKDSLFISLTRDCKQAHQWSLVSSFLNFRRKLPCSLTDSHVMFNDREFTGLIWFKFIIMIRPRKSNFDSVFGAELELDELLELLPIILSDRAELELPDLLFFKMYEADVDFLAGVLTSENRIMIFSKRYTSNSFSGSLELLVEINTLSKYKSSPNLDIL